MAQNPDSIFSFGPQPDPWTGDPWQFGGQCPQQYTQSTDPCHQPSPLAEIISSQTWPQLPPPPDYTWLL